MIGGDLGKPGRDGGEGLIPENALKGSVLLAWLKLAFRDAGTSAHGVEQTVWRVDAVEKTRDLAAEEAAGDGMAGVAGNADELAGGEVFSSDNTAGIRAVERAGGVMLPRAAYGLAACRLRRTGWNAVLVLRNGLRGFVACRCWGHGMILATGGCFA